MRLETDSNKASALQAKSMAQWIAFAPFVFQASVVIRDSGLLEAIDEAGESGGSVTALAQETGLSEYGVKVLLDFGASIGLVWQENGRFILSKTGYFVLNDEMTRVNMDFTRDVCYRALDHLGDSIKDGKPRGLPELGEWDTLYEGLTKLPGTASESWFRFDHYYSDRVFDELLPIVFEAPVKEILDIGGNTGRWALQCLAHDSDVRVTIMDLPIQLKVARKNITEAGFADRYNEYPANVLDEGQIFYKGADVICMSQFLDCFSEQEILEILKRAVAVMDTDTDLYIIELLWDRQKYEAASFSLNATSLYFTCIANGNSRMYHSSDLLGLINEAGLVVEMDIDGVGEGHTLLRCKRSS
ncbi:MAG: class I SAM-dependent methyltransferase [Gammaproteobacteria bacterium]